MKNFIKTVLMGVILCAVIWGLGIILTPKYWDWNADNKFKGMYQDERNTVQAVMLGTSSADNAFAASALYETYGITAYNLATDQQPLIASLCWAREMKRLHGDTLKFVILDVSYLFKTATENQEAEYYLEKYFHYMKLTPEKLKILLDLNEYYDDFQIMDYLIPALRYHSRWDRVDENDLTLITEQRNVFYARGQNVTTKVTAYNNEAKRCLVPDYTITEEMDYSEEEIKEFLADYETEVLDEIAEFCDQEGLRLVMVKLPKDWTDQQHDALVYLAEQYKADYIDYNLVSLQEECGLDMPYDEVDLRHINAVGAAKITDYLGKYLRDHYTFDDMRENSACDYMKEQASTWNDSLEDAMMVRCDDLNEYLKLLDNERYTVFVSVKGDAAKGLTDENRANIAALGLEKLSGIKENESYVGILSHGEVITEKISTNVKKGVFLSGTYIDGKITLDEPHASAYDTNSQSEDMLKMQSKGMESGNNSKIVFGKEEHSLNFRGINLVVCNDETASVVDCSSFETSNKGARKRENEGIFNWNEYNLQVAKGHLHSLTSVAEYISAANEKGMISILCKYPGEAVAGYTAEEQAVLASLGIDGPAEALPGTAYYMYYAQGAVREEALVPAGEILAAASPSSISPYSVEFSAENNEYQILFSGKSYPIPVGVQSVLVYDPVSKQVADFKQFVA